MKRFQMNNLIFALKRLGGVIGLSLVLVFRLLVLVYPARAGGVVGDGTQGSCTEAAFAAVFNSGGFVTFNCGPEPVIITLTSRYSNPAVTIDGGNLVTLDGSGDTGMFEVGAESVLTLTNITLTGGHGHDRGIIENFGEFTAINVTFQAMNPHPGARSHSPILSNKSGIALLQNSTIRDSVNFDDAGGPTPVIYTAVNNSNSDAALFIENCEFIANNGGAIFSMDQGQVTITDSTFRENFGGRPSIQTNFYLDSGHLAISNSLFEQNQSGAVAHSGYGSMTISDTQFISNTGSQAYNLPAGGIYIGHWTADVTITGSEFRGNASPDNGGAISILGGGPLTVTTSTFQNNHSSNQGGAFYISGSKVTVSDSVFLSNDADSGGGAIAGSYLYSTGDLTVHNSQFISNAAGFLGGAIYHDYNGLFIYDSRFEDNEGTSGGGVYINGSYSGSPTEYLAVERSSFVNNRATAWGSNGGGVNLNGVNYHVYESVFTGNQVGEYSNGGGLNSSPFAATGTIRNTTFSGNSASNFGGGLYHNTGTVYVINSTFAAGAASAGGNIGNAGGTFNIVNSLVADPTSGGNCSAPVTSQGHNLESTDTCGFNHAGDLVNTVPLLGLLQDNGGNTLTHLLLANSPALESGDEAACPDADQRGVTRPQNNHCDIGAVEMEPNLTPVADAGLDQSVITGESVTLDGAACADPDGHLPLSYTWTQTGGPSVALSGADTASPVFTPSVNGIYTFELVVTDALGLLSTPDEVVITVTEVAGNTIYLPILVR